MFYINHNKTLEEFEQLLNKYNIKSNSAQLPETFNLAQFKALEVFKQRIFLEEIIEKTIEFNKKIVWPNEDEKIHLTTTAEELIEVLKLRSDVYKSINYQNEFPDTIEGLNFDKYDTTSAIVYYKNNTKITGSIRLIFDSDFGLPTENKCSFSKLRTKFNTIGELSRNVVYNEGKGLNLEFKYLMRGIYYIFKSNNIDIALSGIKREHFKLFEKLGGVDILKEMDSYGSLKVPFLVISYNPKFASNFFKKVFLN